MIYFRSKMKARWTQVILMLTCFMLVLDVVSTEARQSEKRRKDKASSTERTQAVNICDITDRDSKVHCYCDETTALRNVSRAECWVFNGGIPIDDTIWDAFQSQSRLQELSFNVRADGGLGFVPTRALRYMRRLKKLNIKYANIDEIYSFAFANLTTLKEITLQRNKIVTLETNAISHMQNLTILTMDENRISEINKNVFVDLPNLQKLYLTSNNISIIQDVAFKDLVQLLELELDKNSISLLNRNTFDGLANLKRLDLRSNRIRQLNDFTFAELWNLQELQLDNNELKIISERAFDGLSQLKTLSLSDNRLVVLTSGLFEGVRGLAYLDIRQNKLQTLSHEDVRPILENLRTSDSHLLLDENNFLCDCRLTWMHVLRNDTRNEKTKDSLEHITCTLDSTRGNNNNQYLDNTVDKTQHTKAYSHTDTNKLQDKPKHKVLNQKSPIEYLDAPDKNGMEDEAYDEQKDGTNQNNPGHVQNDTVKKANRKHLFQIPVELLPCPEELKDSTEAPLSRPSRGEVKDFRGIVSSVENGVLGGKIISSYLLIFFIVFYLFNILVTVYDN